MDIKLENTVDGQWYDNVFFSWERSIKPNCMFLAAELDSNLIWIYTEPSLLCSLYFGFLALLWFVLLPISVVSFLSACLVLFSSTKSTTFLAATPFLVLCYIHLQYKFSRLIRKKTWEMTGAHKNMNRPVNSKKSTVA